MQRTQNYNLCQWAAEDRILRSDFNADNQKIDAALAAGVKIATGSYVGNGTFGESNARTLTFGFVPKIVFVVNASMSSSDYRATLINGCPVAQSSDYIAYGITNVIWDDAARSVTWYSKDGNNGVNAMLNRNGSTYLYAALG